MKRAFVLLAFVTGCRIIAPQNFPVGADAGPPERAAVVCSQLRKLGCPEGNPSPKGETCETLYTRIPDALDGRCVAAAETAATLRDDCNVRCGESDDGGGPW